jgi:UDP-3-O-[3-hydroxymyristoyl] glucosamine N-acyltransferase
MTLSSELAAEFGLNLIGPDNDITDICSLDKPNKTGLAFLRAKELPDPLPEIGALLVLEDTKLPRNSVVSFLKTKDPLLTFSKIVPKFRPPSRPSVGVHPTAIVAQSTKLDEGVSIGAYSVIEDNCTILEGSVIHSHVVVYPNCSIGKGVTIHSHAVIREGTVIKDGCTIQPGAVIGGDGFGYVLDPSMGLVSVPQVGTVVLEERVDVGSNSCIDRATIGETRIGLGTKIDNLVQVGHNVEIGEHSIICGQAGIAGSTKLGKKVVLGGQAGVADHKFIADEVRVAAGSGVVSNLTEKGDYSGYPAIKATTWRKIQVIIRKLVK